jgi:hypothetical protein
VAPAVAPFTNERQHGFKLGPVDVFAGCLVGKHLVERDTFQLEVMHRMFSS